MCAGAGCPTHVEVLGPSRRRTPTTHQIRLTRPKTCWGPRDGGFTKTRAHTLFPPLIGRRKGTYNFWVHNFFQTFPPGEKRKMSTNRVAIGPIRAILCAQKAMFLGYILGRFRALGRPKKSPKIAPESFPRQWEKSSKCYVYVFFCALYVYMYVYMYVCVCICVDE